MLIVTQKQQLRIAFQCAKLNTKDYFMLKDYYLEALEETQKRLQKGKQIWLTNASFVKEGNNSITISFPAKMYLNSFKLIFWINFYCKNRFYYLYILFYFMTHLFLLFFST